VTFLKLVGQSSALEFGCLKYKWFPIINVKANGNASVTYTILVFHQFNSELAMRTWNRLTVWAAKPFERKIFTAESPRFTSTNLFDTSNNFDFQNAQVSQYDVTTKELQSHETVFRNGPWVTFETDLSEAQFSIRADIDVSSHLFDRYCSKASQITSGTMSPY
jgi:hypothetical protein